MTTMNYPANYAVIDSEEMTYVTGGTAWDVFSDASTFFYRVAYGPYALVTSVGYFKDGLAAVDSISNATGILGALNAIGNVIWQIGYGIYYAGTSIRQPYLAQTALTALQADFAE